MPIRPELRHLYRGPVYRAQRARIMKRAGGKCEQCRKPNGRLVWVFKSEFCGQYWSSSIGAKQAWHYSLLGGITGNFFLTRTQAVRARERKALRRIRSVLTMAHLDHDAANGDDENLKMLCQWCHLNYDKLHHKETRQVRKDAARPLLAGIWTWPPADTASESRARLPGAT